ncbi:MAG: hypothetical protein FDW93_04475 [Bergeyella sp.]|nr:hypothetical protein [Bergeyella sp.]
MHFSQTILQIHRGFAYAEFVCILLYLIALFGVMFSYSGKITGFLRKISVFTMVFFHLQFLIGIVMLLGTSPFLDIIKNIGMGEVMKIKSLRFAYIEHPFSMFIGAVLVTMVNKKIKTKPRLSMGVFFLAILAVLLFFYALPFSKLVSP